MMPSFLVDALFLLIGLVAMINPLAITPIFLALTQGQTPSQRRRTATRGMVAALVIMLASFLFGQNILYLFGISLPAFQVAGGLMLGVIGLEMARGISVVTEPGKHGDDFGSVAVVPLAMPVTIGPGVITALIVQSGSAETAGSVLAGVIVILVAALITWTSFSLAHRVVSTLGQDVMIIATRLGGLVLVSIGVTILTDGLGKLLPGLMG
jgi:MarC family membrane protein